MVRVATARDMRGAALASDGTVVVAITANSFLTVNSAQGQNRPLMTVDVAAGDASHRWPSILPDDRAVLFSVRSKDPARRGVTLSELGASTGTRLVDTDWNALVADDHLFYVRGRALVAQPLDLTNRRLTGEPTVVVDAIAAGSSGHAAFGVSRTGVLAYAEPIRNVGEIVSLARDGRLLGAPVAPAAEYVDVSLSPDGRHLAFSPVDPERNTPDVWTLDLTRGLTQRLTSDRMTDANPHWSADGTGIAFRSNRDGTNKIYLRGLAETRDEELTLRQASDLDTTNMMFTHYSRDARYLVLTTTGRATSFDVWVVETGNTPRVLPVAQTEFDEYHGVLSPDNRWLAYVSNETGTPQVFVQSFPEARQRFQVSSEGGIEPQWRADGRELFFVASEGSLMAVTVAAGTSIQLGSPRRLFRAMLPASRSPYRRHYAAATDGQQFFVVRAAGDLPPPAINVVLDWRALAASR